MFYDGLVSIELSSIKRTENLLLSAYLFWKKRWLRLNHIWLHYYNTYNIYCYVCVSCSTDYVPTKSSYHSPHIMGEYLYMLGGNIDILPKVHIMKSNGEWLVIELFHLSTGRWEQRPTNGKPLLGVYNYASTVFGNKIYYFGGPCNHDLCHHNSLNLLITDSLRWMNCFQLIQVWVQWWSQTVRWYTIHLINWIIHWQLVDSVFVLPLHNLVLSIIIVFMFILMSNTIISYPVVRRSIYYVINTLYIKYNFITVFISGQWIIPDISGEQPLPFDNFTLTLLPNNRALLFGGYTPNGYDNIVYIAQCTKTAVVSTICTKLKYLVTVKYCGVIKLKFEIVEWNKFRVYNVFILLLGTVLLMNKSFTVC